MPELPEVETIRRVLLPQVKGQTVTEALIYNAQVIARPDAKAFKALVTGRTITGMGRRGKFLSLFFDNGDRLFFHLRMTGQLLVTPPDFETEKHTHIILRLAGGNELRYIDVRRFGRLWYIRKEEDAGLTGVDKLGIEPDSPELTGAYLKARLGRKLSPVKAALLDQSVVCGIGNIYSDEILFASRMHPEAKCCLFTDADWELLAEKIPAVIAWGIESDKMTPEEYLAGRGKEYRNIPELKAYGREGLPCPVCGTIIERLVVGGRSSCFCPACQKEPKC